MRKPKGKRPKLPVACVATALLIAGFSLLSSLARGVGVVEPHVWVETAPADGKSVERQSRYRAVGAVMDGEVARTAERLREAQAVATAAGLFVVTERVSGRATRGVGELVAGLSARNLLPPGLTAGRQEGTLLSRHGTLFVRYRPAPLGVEVVALGRECADGPAVMVRVPDDREGEDGALVFTARQLDGVVIPQAFTPVAEVVALGWAAEKFRAS
jgi:hypothetical protein